MTPSFPSLLGHIPSYPAPYTIIWWSRIPSTTLGAAHLGSTTAAQAVTYHIRQLPLKRCTSGILQEPSSANHGFYHSRHTCHSIITAAYSMTFATVPKWHSTASGQHATSSHSARSMATQLQQESTMYFMSVSRYDNRWEHLTNELERKW
jgi:hypothetical protein